MSAADVIGILGFALHALHKVYNAGQTIKNAPDEMRAFQDEVANVESLLRQIESTEGSVRSEDDISRLPVHVIAKARKLTAAAEKFIERTTTIIDDGTRKVKRSTWPLHTAKAQALAGEFKWLYMEISAVYSVHTSARVHSLEPRIALAVEQGVTGAMQHEMATLMDARLRHTVGEIEHLIQEQQETTARAIVHALASAAREQREGRHQLFDEFSILRDGPHATSWAPVANLVHSSTGSRESDFQSTIIVESSHASSSQRSPPAGRESSQSHCPSNCRCRCHWSSSDYQLVPSVLAPWLGIRISGSLVSSLSSATIACDDTRCTRTRDRLSDISQWLPMLFARAEAIIRSRSYPVQFKIQTPRVVQSLSFLWDISLDEFKRKMTTCEITVNDVEQDGFTVLHCLVARAVNKQGDASIAYAMMHLAIDGGARHDWEHCGFTVTEYLLHYSKWSIRDTSRISSITQSFAHNIAKPLLQEDSIEEVWDSMRTKQHWSDLHYLVVNPPDSSAQLKRELATILGWPSAPSDVNTMDRFGRTPLRDAIRSCPDVVDALLRAGANPYSYRHTAALHPAMRAQSWGAVGSLIRAGADVNERRNWPNGALTTPLHDIVRAWSLQPCHRLRTARELIRHAGHMLDWDAEDERGWTPLDWAELLVNKHPGDEDVVSLCELYKTRRLAFAAQFIDTSHFPREAKTIGSLACTSLISAGLEANIEAIGVLIAGGAMVNERDEDGRTLLHLVAMGVVPNGYAVVIELVRHGGYGVDWDAVTADGETAEALAKQTFEHLSTDDTKERISKSVPSVVKRRLSRLLPIRRQQPSSTRYKVARDEAAMILELVQRRVLPAGIHYIYPCMHPEYCRKCSSYLCRCCRDEPEDRLKMPGGWD